MNPAPLTPSFPRKQESSDFSSLPSVRARGRLSAPAFSGATTWRAGGISSDALTLLYGLVTAKSAIPGPKDSLR
jgi:hypothetical protein